MHGEKEKELPFIGHGLRPDTRPLITHLHQYENLIRKPSLENDGEETKEVPRKRRGVQRSRRGFGEEVRRSERIPCLPK